MLKQKCKSPEFLISAAGLAVLAGIFLLWLARTDVTLPGLTAAILSAALFAAVCLRFVPEWMHFWRSGVQAEAEAPGVEDRRTELAVFFALLLLDAAILAAAFVFRRLLGYDETFAESLSFWTGTDSRHYLDIARDWYLSEGSIDRLVQLVFFPGYPIAIRLVNFVVGDYLYSGLLVSAFSFAGAGCMAYRLLRLDLPRGGALRVIKYLCLLPGVFFFAAPMSESLFLLLCVSCVYCTRSGKWLLGCVLGALAAFTRSLGVMLFVPLFFEAVAAFSREISADKTAGKRLAARIAGLLIIPLGFAAYCVINYLVSGDPFKFMQYQKEHWGQSFGWFFNTAAYQTELALTCARDNPHNALGLWLPNLIACFGSLTAMLFAAKRLRPSYTAWFIAYFVVAVGATWLLSAPRYLIALLPVPLAFALDTENPNADFALSLICGAAGILYFAAFVLRWQVW